MSERVEAAIEITDLRRSFGPAVVLDGVSLAVQAGEVHALLGPNGAGKTTLLRILTGLVTFDSGQVRVLGRAMDGYSYTAYRQLFGLVPSGDRTFYLRLSGYENLLFFARLHGLRGGGARERSMECLAAVGLADASHRAVGLYSHGMQKRLSVARALLGEPRVLFVDEATHDLDPEGADRVRRLIEGLTAQGCAVLWTTQRLEEVRGFADEVTVLVGGRTAFNGSVPRLLARAVPTRYLLLLEDEHSGTVLETANAALGSMAVLCSSGDEDDRQCLLELASGVALGDALAALAAARLRIMHCTEERSGLERAFLGLVEGTA